MSKNPLYQEYRIVYDKLRIMEIKDALATDELKEFKFAIKRSNKCESSLNKMFDEWLKRDINLSQKGGEDQMNNVRMSLLEKLYAYGFLIFDPFHSSCIINPYIMWNGYKSDWIKIKSMWQKLK